MTVQAFYEKVGGNYKEVVSRLRTDDRITKFVMMFADDESYQSLIHALDEQDVDNAFLAAHTIKGMCQNMAFTRLQKSSMEITELLRAKDLESARSMCWKVTEDYNLLMEGIKELKADN